ncbi:MAG: hypothetical protein ACREOU_15820 [Candidatus Eiseniibacteriota bacterium]
MEQNLWQAYQKSHPGQVQVLGADIYNGTPSQLRSFKTSTGTTYPLLLLAATATGGNMSTLYGPWDNYVVINKQGIVRYHAADLWPHGNRYHLDQIRGTVDSLVTDPLIGVGDGPAAASLSLSGSPNPFRGALTVVFRIPARAVGSEARLELFSPAGRRIATLWQGRAPESGVRVVWRGATNEGARLAPGLYCIRGTADGLSVTLRVVHLP